MSKGLLLGNKREGGRERRRERGMDEERERGKEGDYYVGGREGGRAGEWEGGYINFACDFLQKIGPQFIDDGHIEVVGFWASTFVSTCTCIHH